MVAQEFPSKASPDMSDMVVSIGLNIVEEQVLVRVLVEHEKSMMTDISESFSEN